MNGLLKPTPSDYCQVWKPKMSSAQAVRRQGEREQEQDQNTHPGCWRWNSRSIYLSRTADRGTEESSSGLPVNQVVDPPASGVHNAGDGVCRLPISDPCPMVYSRDGVQWRSARALFHSFVWSSAASVAPSRWYLCIWCCSLSMARNGGGPRDASKVETLVAEEVRQLQAFSIHGSCSLQMA